MIGDHKERLSYFCKPTEPVRVRKIGQQNHNQQV